MNPIRFGGVTPRPHRHTWLVGDGPTYCSLCGKVDDGSRRRNTNNRKRGGAAELEVAKLLGGQKVGPLNLPWDVTVPGYARLQVKKLARLPSLSQVARWLDEIPVGAEMRGVAVIEAGRGGRRLVVFELDEYAERHGR